MPNCLHNARCAAERSNCQTGSARTGGLPPRDVGSSLSSGTRISAGCDSLQHASRFGERHVGQREGARHEVQPGDSGTLANGNVRGEKAVALGVEQIGVGERAGRDDARHLALDRTLAGGRVADLLDDHHRFALPHELREVRLERVIGNARHRNRRPGRLSAGGQRDVEQARRAFGVDVEQLVEVAHPVEQQLVRMLCLDAKILLHHRRMGGKRCGHPRILMESPSVLRAPAQGGPFGGGAAFDRRPCSEELRGRVAVSILVPARQRARARNQTAEARIAPAETACRAI